MNTLLQVELREDVAGMSADKQSAPGLIAERDYGRCELYGFEVDMSGHVIIPELHPPRSPEALSAFIEFESELRAAIDAAV
jgi:hypothetical protein